MTEAELQANVIDTAHVFGWIVAHFRPARTEQGWRTPVSADGKGFPDLVLISKTTIAFVELKSARGKESPEQQMWLEALRRVISTTFLWRPDDWTSGRIEAFLRENA